MRYNLVINKNTPSILLTLRKSAMRALARIKFYRKGAPSSLSNQAWFWQAGFWFIGSQFDYSLGGSFGSLFVCLIFEQELRPTKIPCGK